MMLVVNFANTESGKEAEKGMKAWIMGIHLMRVFSEELSNEFQYDRNWMVP